MNVNWNFPKDKHDWYAAGAAVFSITGFAVATNFPTPDWTVKAGFWMPQVFAVAFLTRWWGASMWSDVSNSRTLLRMRINAIQSEDDNSEAALREKARKEYAAKHEPQADGFLKLVRKDVEAAKSGMVMNTQTVEMPKLNVRTYFWTCVLRAYDLDKDGQKYVDLTEDTWVTKRKLFYQKPFAAMKQDALRVGALKRRHSGPKAPFIVNSRGMVEYLTRNDFPSPSELGN